MSDRSPIPSPLRPLGTTGLSVPLIGLGLVKIGRTRGLKHPGTPTLPSDERVAELLRTAAELGVNLLDTAPAYGVSEQRLGERLAADDFFGLGRDGWIISTKAGEEFDEASAESSYDFSPEHMGVSVRRSLERLRIDHLDVVLVHTDGRDAEIVRSMGTLDALADLKRRGLVRAIGMSTKSAEGLEVAVSEGGVDVVMATLNPAYSDELSAIRDAHERGVGILIKKALESGHAGDPGDALRWVVREGGEALSSVVVGTTSAEHLRANIAAAREALS